MSNIAETAAVVGSVALVVETLYGLGALWLLVRKELPSEVAGSPPQDILLMLARSIAIYVVALYGVYFQRAALLGTPLGKAICWCIVIVLIVESLRRYWSPPLRRYYTVSGTIVRMIGAVSFSIAAIGVDI